MTKILEQHKQELNELLKKREELGKKIKITTEERKLLNNAISSKRTVIKNYK